jgi:lipoprotein-anchoring transpeptidase ErfK/SrfK
MFRRDTIPAMRRRPVAVVVVLVLGMALAACSSGSDAPPTPPPATGTPTPGPPTATAFPTFTPTPILGAGSAIVVGGDLRVRSEPSTTAPELGTLPDQAPLVIDRAVEGENWLLGAQTWPSTVPAWTRTWYRLVDGTYVYAGFVFIQQPGEASPLLDAGDQEKWVDINVTTQTATAMLGGWPVYVAPVSTGSPQFPSPLGSHKIQRDGRLAVERMTSAQAGYDPSQARYDVERVLFTQYYDLSGDALHLNYWRPEDVFGRTATSHGCVGMQLHDAQWFWLFGFAGMRVEIHT